MKLIKLASIFLVAAIVSSCEKEEYAVGPPSGIAFAEQNVNVVLDPADPTYNLKVQATTVSNVDRTLTYTVNADTNLTTEGTTEANYSISGTVTIPAGELTGTTLVTFTPELLTYDPKMLSFDLAIPDPSFGYKIDTRETVTINYSKICDQTPVLLTLNFDNYASETYWRLVNLANPTQIIAEVAAGTYVDGDVSTSASFCLPPGNYRIVLRDTVGDGFCCDYGEGDYSVSVNGTQVASGSGSFATTKNVNFQVQ